MPTQNIVDVAVADEDRVGNNLLQISKLRFGQKAYLLFRLWAQCLEKILKWKSRQDLKLEFGHFFLLMFCKGRQLYENPSHGFCHPQAIIRQFVTLADYRDTCSPSVNSKFEL